MPSTAAASPSIPAGRATPPVSIDRFQIRRELGRGGHSTVYLAHDPKLDRLVALKLLHPGASSGDALVLLLQEARAVSRLSHPNIVPVFDAGEQNNQAYLIFEYVEGRTLADALRQSGAMPAREAVELLLPLLDALEHAHAAGLVHRDLKPSNILLDEQGAPRLMDFGVATRAGDDTAALAQLVGTPAYMAPEVIQGGPATPAADVFAMGLILYEMLTGARAIANAEPMRMLYQIAHQDLRLPHDPRHPIDEKLSAIVHKALNRDTALRFDTVQRLQQALSDWLNPLGKADSQTEKGVESDAAPAAHGTVEFLLRRMRLKSDFPALSDAVRTLNKLTASDTENISTLANAILKDFGLTNKLLRLVNSTYYRGANGGAISTISRAIVVLGMTAIRNLAISVLLFEHLQNQSHAALLRDEFLRACIAGQLARDLCGRQGRDAEEAFVCAMFHNLGRLLSKYYLPEESAEISRLIEREAVAEPAAAVRVLGVSYEQIGMAVAQSWGFPPLISRSMRHFSANEVVKKPNTYEDWARSVAGFAEHLTQVLENRVDGTPGPSIDDVIKRFQHTVPNASKLAKAALERSGDEIRMLSTLLHANVAQSRIGRAILSAEPDQAGVDAAPSFTPGQTLEAAAAQAAAHAPPVTPSDPVNSVAPVSLAGSQQVQSEDRRNTLAAGIQDISNALVDDSSVNDILRIVLETMYRAIGFHRVLFCLRDMKIGAMVGRFGLGPEINHIVKHFRVPLGPSEDLFAKVMARGADLLITDAREPSIQKRLPAWHQQYFQAETFLLLPLIIKQAPVAMIYADCPKAGDIVVCEKELSLLRTLRNQAVLAIKQG